MFRKITALFLMAGSCIAASTNAPQIVTATNSTSTRLSINNVPITNLSASIVITEDFGWEDLRFPASQLGSHPTKSPSWQEVETDIWALRFNNSSENAVYGLAQFPHEWLAGSRISPHIHVCNWDNVATNTTMVFELAYTWASINSIFSTSVTRLTITNTTPANDLHEMWEFPAITDTNATESSVMHWLITRKTGDGGDDGGYIYLEEFDIHYQVEKPTGEQASF